MRTDVVESTRLKPELLVKQETGRARNITVDDALLVGRLFGFRPAPGGASLNSTSIGTVGGIFATQKGEKYALSAGHVFVDTCAAAWEQSNEGVLYRRGFYPHALTPTQLKPRILGRRPEFRDATVVRLLGRTLPEPRNCGWPPEFTGDFATAEDVAMASRLNRASEGYVWVERDAGVSRRVQIEVFSTSEKLEYQPEWCSRSAPIQFTSLFAYTYPFLHGSDGNPANEPYCTIDGDSGAGVFIRDYRNPSTCKLLGVHVMKSYDSRNRVMGLAVGVADLIENILPGAVPYGNARLSPA
ncbi:MAG: hypothetical protein KF791_03585 [Verrucomicrobiae bacterium]|nr:hypothetical protein [Verrucomicrobiae bacterium]